MGRRTAASRLRQPQELRPTTLQLGVGMVVVSVLAKLVMMYDESKETDRIARRARRFAEEQEGLDPLTREEWDAVTAARPQTPYDSAFTRTGARIRTGSWPSLGEAYSWGGVVLTDAMKRAESGQSSR
ncbi:hypothetical protein CLOM_g16435 [Closterium sp. NIES-68]|nr:hypothetical protein CLOM_g16435 [Closterium sp. NIES-68]GJP78258.1 hypothetical protein CLOP_g8583 [Closterium sp. NIES-67]